MSSTYIPYSAIAAAMRSPEGLLPGDWEAIGRMGEPGKDSDSPLQPELSMTEYQALMCARAFLDAVTAQHLKDSCDGTPVSQARTRQALEGGMVPIKGGDVQPPLPPQSPRAEI